MQSASTASLASLDARSPSAAEMLRDSGARGGHCWPELTELDLAPLLPPLVTTLLLGVSGADLRPWPGRGSMMTSEKLWARSSVELLDEHSASVTWYLILDDDWSCDLWLLVSVFRILLVGILLLSSVGGSITLWSKLFFSMLGPGTSSGEDTWSSEALDLGTRVGLETGTGPARVWGSESVLWRLWAAGGGGLEDDLSDEDVRGDCLRWGRGDCLWGGGGLEFDLKNECLDNTPDSELAAREGETRNESWKYELENN